MQKIDFVKNLEVIVERLKSKEILDHFQKGFLNPSKGYQYNQINPLLFLSKSNYDYIKADIKYSEILKSLNGDAVYSEQNLSILTVVLQQNSANQIIQNQNTLAFFNFHNSLVSTLELVKNVLISDSLNLSLDNSLNNGVVIFQILIPSIVNFSLESKYEKCS